ncbi:MAG: hypothetical protein WKF97_19395 [Chitinophagaceae bacterium]
MNNYQYYIDELNKIASTVFAKNEPKSNSTSGGRIARLKSYISDFPEQLSKINDEMVIASNKLLEDASKNNLIDTSKLKEDFSTIFKNHHSEWMKKHKPK